MVKLWGQGRNEILFESNLLFQSYHILDLFDYAQEVQWVTNTFVKVCFHTQYKIWAHTDRKQVRALHETDYNSWQQLRWIQNQSEGSPPAFTSENVISDGTALIRSIAESLQRDYFQRIYRRRKLCLSIRCRALSFKCDDLNRSTWMWAWDRVRRAFGKTKSWSSSVLVGTWGLVWMGAST